MKISRSRVLPLRVSLSARDKNTIVLKSKKGLCFVLYFSKLQNTNTLLHDKHRENT